MPLLNRWTNDIRFLIVTEYRGAGGYSAICEGLALGLDHLGHEIKVLGLNFDGSEHPLPNSVSIIPVHSIDLMIEQVTNIASSWRPDFAIVMFDLPHQVDISQVLAHSYIFKYIGIFPVEGEPLSRSWAGAVMDMDYAFTISKFGVQVCEEAGARVRYLPVAVTPGVLSAKEDDRAKMRKHLFLEGRRSILKVADNHTRKNWSDTIQFFARWHHPKDVLCAVTRPENGYGWDLYDLCEQNGAVKIPGTNTVYEWGDGAQMRILAGLDRRDLAWLYNVCDCLLVDSGAEGACMPIFEAFHLSLPVVGMNHTALPEALEEGRGVLYGTGFEYVDPFGNVKRYYNEYDSWASGLNRFFGMSAEEKKEMTAKAKAWIDQRTWVSAARVIEDALREYA